MKFIEVAIAAPIHSTLTYGLGELNKEATIPTGKRVLVPLSGRLVTGYVFGEQEKTSFDYVVKDIREILDTVPLFHPTLIPFFHWVASYYHYPIGLVLKTALPSGLNTRTVKKIELINGMASSLEKISFEDNKRPDWVKKLIDSETLSIAMSRKVLHLGKNKKILNLLRNKGIIQFIESIEHDKIREKTETCFKLSSSVQEELKEKTKDEFKQFYQEIKDWDGTVKLSEAKTLYHITHLLEQKPEESFIPQKELYRNYSGASKAIAGLKNKKFVSSFNQRVYRNPLGEQLTKYSPPKELSQGQKIALKEIKLAAQKKAYRPYLLHGVTGSGKTEVYLRATEETLRLGRDVLVLVPEIALATQLESHFVSRFGDKVVLLHSGLSAGEKYDQWTLAASGIAKIVIGARSAVFAPLRDPGLVIVDEEHDQGFKQDGALCYQGRDLAILRASMQNSVVILGSATPSLVSYFHAQNGKYGLLEMQERVGGGTQPGVTIVDLQKNKGGENKGIIRSEMATALIENFKNGKQSLLLLNRRGFAGTFLCQDCGTNVECLHCHVSLTYHKGQNKLVCHYCGYTLSSTIVCNSCRSPHLVPIGVGTERVEEEVRAKLPEARVARLDSDTARDRKKFIKILKSMHLREIDILIGTQMVAKGHHFPHVTFVGIVWADGGLNMPDFRAAERAYQLISQVTGRAGRGRSAGKVIIQTMRPDHYSLVFAQKHQYEEFFNHELSIRQNPAFPPHVRVVALRFSGEQEYDVKKTAGNFAQLCKKVISENKHTIEILGPAPSPLDRLHDKFRWQMLLKGTSIESLHNLCATVQESTKLNQGRTRVVIDVDPENMM